MTSDRTIVWGSAFVADQNNNRNTSGNATG
jgi:hypothetical protein